jgi:hypothetical protein
MISPSLWKSFPSPPDMVSWGDDEELSQDHNSTSSAQIYEI